MKFLCCTVLLFSSTLTLALPVNPGLSHRRQNDGLPGIGEGPAQATDGSTIVENQVTINGLPIRFKVSAPADQFLSNGAGAGAGTGTAGTGIGAAGTGTGGGGGAGVGTKVKTNAGFRKIGRASTTSNAQNSSANSTASTTGSGALGINVLFHGDGGQSFFDFPVRFFLPLV